MEETYIELSDRYAERARIMELDFLELKYLNILLRTALATAFPGVKFSVAAKSRVVNVSWEDGPTIIQANAIAGTFRYQEPVKPILYNDKEYLSPLNWLTFHRTYSKGYMAEVARLYCLQHGYNVPALREVNLVGWRVDSTDHRNIKTANGMLNDLIFESAKNMSPSDLPAMRTMIASLKSSTSEQEEDKTKQECITLETRRIHLYRALELTRDDDEAKRAIKQELDDLYQQVCLLDPSLSHPCICSFCFRLHAHFMQVRYKFVCPVCLAREVEQLAPEDVEWPKDVEKPGYYSPANTLSGAKKQSWIFYYQDGSITAVDLASYRDEKYTCVTVQHDDRAAVKCCEMTGKECRRGLILQQQGAQLTHPYLFTVGNIPIVPFNWKYFIDRKEATVMAVDMGSCHMRSDALVYSAVGIAYNGTRDKPDAVSTAIADREEISRDEAATIHPEVFAYIEKAEAALLASPPPMPDPNAEPVPTPELIYNEEGQEIDVNGRPYPILRKDPDDNWFWLKFHERFGDDILAAMHQYDWHWRRYRQEWSNQSMFAVVPPLVVATYGKVVDEGEVEYAAERASRLRTRSTRLRNEANSDASASDRVIETKLSTMVVVQGGRAGRRNQKALEQSKRLAELAATKDEKADYYDDRANGSERHQEKRNRIDKMARRVDRLKKEKKKYEKDHLLMIHHASPSVSDPTSFYYRSPDTIYQAKEEKDRRCGILQKEISELEQKIADAGGLAFDQVTIEVGDKIYIRSDVYEVNKVNPKTIYCVGNYLSGHPYIMKLDKSEFRHIVYKADGTYVETDEQQAVRFPVRKARPSEPIKEERTFKHEEVATVSIWSDNPYSFYPTPPDVSDRLFEMCGDPGEIDRALEPNGGAGTLADAMKRYFARYGQAPVIDTCEIQYGLQKTLTEKGYTVVEEDFFALKGRTYPFIGMNPPFTIPGNSLAWLDMVLLAWEMLEEGGTLGAVLPLSFFRDHPRINAFRDLVETVGEWKELPAGAFQVSGTNIPTVLICMRK